MKPHFFLFQTSRDKKLKVGKCTALAVVLIPPPPILFSRIRHWETCERAAARENNLHTINASRRKAAADDTDKVSATTSPHFFTLSFFLSLMSSHAAVPLAQRFISALHLSLVRMLHFLPALLTLRENQYLLVPAGRTNSLWNSVFLRHTQSLEDATQQPLAKPLAAAAAVAASCSITAHSSKQGLGILWSWMQTEATLTGSSPKRLPLTLWFANGVLSMGTRYHFWFLNI